VIFSSPRFAVFLAGLLLLLAPRWRLRTKLDLLLAGSCLFYAAWDWRYLGLLLLVSLVNYECGARIAASEDARRRRFWLVASIAASLGVLGYFKYAGFFVENANALLAGFGVQLPALRVLLPAGISFYTFKTMSYTIDIYRRELAPCRSWRHYATFVTFFPELIAGPIVRASVFLPQMDRRIGPTAQRLQLGASIFLLGLTKKLLIADPLSTVVDPVYAAPSTFAPATLWMAALAYSLQIYCDFSGYSDMAIGVSKMIGYDLPRNFRMPYLAADPAEFWRRWHITLSTWLRDYLYIPLGGNRRGRLRTYVNLGLTMLLGGLWHGASWNFVLWGGLHGGALALHRAARERRGRPLLPRPLAVPLMFGFATLCWIPFRAPDFATTRLLLTRMFSPGAEGALWVPTWLIRAVVLVAVGHAIGAWLDGALGSRPGRERARRWLAGLGARLESDPISGWHVQLGAARFGGAFVVTAWALLLYFFGFIGTSPFIYFQF
jgi:alginate O-acetyltransferase complex protein AlgI